MPTISLSSDLLEVEFSSQELYGAQTLSNTNLAINLLQNTRVDLIRQLATFTFDDDANTQKELRAHAYLRGKLDMLDELINQAFNPTPVSESPVNPT